jgi:DNA gyrase/topoisomerase IV subunit B
MEEKNKQIRVLSEKDHVRQRSHVYVGSVIETEERIPIIKNNAIYIEPREISIGMYKILNEIIDNSLDEAKRMNGKMKKIKISIDSKSNKVKVTDTGNGFYKGSSINKDSNRSNIETAVSMLRSGSNFDNENIKESLIGNNGLGSALCNCLSEEFSIVTVNDTHYYEQKWHDFERNNPIVRKKTPTDQKGTSIEFKPLRSLFKNYKWDLEILSSSLILKYDLIKRDPIIGKLEIELSWDDESIDLSPEFLPQDSFRINTEIGQITIWEKYEGSGSLSFVNSALCSGIHQKIFNDFVNTKLEDTLGHHFYDCLIVLNLPPKYVKFGDQNKTRFVTTREEIENLLMNKFGAKLQGLFKTELFERIAKKVEERKNDGYVKKLRAEKRKVNLKHSHKYFPAQKAIAENLFIVEGLSAMGSILQKRNPKEDGVYALKGKIKNCKNIGDLSDNKEILELMHILGLDPTARNNEIIGYKRIVIATDPDPDGSHITSLLINLFYKWFPTVIRNKRLSSLKIPLVSVGDGKKRKYYWDMEDFKASKSTGNVRYLKGLGSLSLEDWEWVMNRKDFVGIDENSDSKEKLEMAFGDSSEARKKWLSNIK